MVGGMRMRWVGGVAWLRRRPPREPTGASAQPLTLGAQLTEKVKNFMLMGAGSWEVGFVSKNERDSCWFDIPELRSRVINAESLNGIFLVISKHFRIPSILHASILGLNPHFLLVPTF